MVNHETRFPTSADQQKTFEALWENDESGLKKTKFFLGVMLLGVQSYVRQKAKGGESTALFNAMKKK